MLTAGYGDNTLQRSTVCEWAKRFREGRVSVDDNPREGRPITVRTPSNIRKVKQAVDKNRRVSTRELASSTNLNRETVRTILRQE